MRVIVTRPEHSGERTVNRLAAMGHEGLLLPLTRPLHAAAAASQALGASQGAVALTSAEAIRVLKELGSALAPHLRRTLFVVGRSTAEAARRVGFTMCRDADGNGARLADLVAAHADLLLNAPLLYLAGSPRAKGFETRLIERHISFKTVECYRMVDVDPDEATLRHIFVNGAAEAVLLYSRHTAARLFSLALLGEHPEWLAQTRFLCLSAQVADAIPAWLGPLTEIAAEPNEDHLLALIGRT
jgi:uroporphyrinogen-III synthase